MIALTKDGFQEVHWKDIPALEIICLWKDLDTAYTELAKRYDVASSNSREDYRIDGSTIYINDSEFSCEVYSGGTKELYKKTSELGIKNNKLLNARKSNSVKAFVFENELIGIQYTGTFWFFTGRWTKYC